MREKLNVQEDMDCMRLRDYRETDIPVMLSVIKEAFVEYKGQLERGTKNYRDCKS